MAPVGHAVPSRTTRPSVPVSVASNEEEFPHETYGSCSLLRRDGYRACLVTLEDCLEGRVIPKGEDWYSYSYEYGRLVSRPGMPRDTQAPAPAAYW